MRDALALPFAVAAAAGDLADDHLSGVADALAEEELHSHGVPPRSHGVVRSHGVPSWSHGRDSMTFRVRPGVTGYVLESRGNPELFFQLILDKKNETSSFG